MNKHRDALQQMRELLGNPLTNYGLLVRALRLIANTTLMEMSKEMGTTPAALSAIEFGRAVPDDDFVYRVYDFFYAKGVCVPATLIYQAMNPPAQGPADPRKVGSTWFYGPTAQIVGFRAAANTESPEVMGGWLAAYKRARMHQDNAQAEKEHLEAVADYCGVVVERLGDHSYRASFQGFDLAPEHT